VNLIIIVGNLTRDPEMRYTASGQPVANMGVAVNNGRDKNGEERPPTFFDVTVWGALAERCAEYLRKGRKVLVQGRMDRQTYEDKEGNSRTKWVLQGFSVEFLSPREEGGEAPQQQIHGPRQAQQTDYSDLDDLPF
jgi:single-strand DNA-binding protein